MYTNSISTKLHYLIIHVQNYKIKPIIILKKYSFQWFQGIISIQDNTTACS